MIRPLLATVLALFVSLALAQENTPPTVKVVLPKQAKPGAKVQGTVEITFADGLHGYQNPPTDEYQIPVKVTVDTKGFILAKPVYPKGIMKETGGEPKPIAVYEGTIKIPVTVTVPKKPGASEVKITVGYQQCNEQSCYPPATVSVTAKILVKK